MSELRKLQEDFLGYLTGNVDAIMDNVVKQGNIDRKTRLDIYRNAYTARLEDCIETDHPMLGLYLGDDLFKQLSEGYIRRHPSHYTSLRQFCDHLPDYLKENEPFSSYPVTAEIAAFERKLMDAFDAADGDRAMLADLQNLPAEKWPKMKLAFHPSVQLYEARWNSVECWQALKNGREPPEAQEQQAWWLIWRNSDRLTQYRSISIDGFILYRCFKDQYTFADACELLREHLPENLIGPTSVDYLSAWFNLGIIGSIYC